MPLGQLIGFDYDQAPGSQTREFRYKKQVQDYLNWLGKGGGFQNLQNVGSQMFGMRGKEAIAYAAGQGPKPQQPLFGWSRGDILGQALDFVNPMAKVGGMLGTIAKTGRVSNLVDYRQQRMEGVASEARELMEQTGREFSGRESPGEIMAAFESWAQFEAPDQLLPAGRKIWGDWDKTAGKREFAEEPVQTTESFYDPSSMPLINRRLRAMDKWRRGMALNESEIKDLTRANRKKYLLERGK